MLHVDLETAGHMIRLFLERGFHGACHDLGTDSRAMMRANLRDLRAQIRAIDELDELSESAFDYLFAFEVLEHIQHDSEALTEWLRYLRPGGKILLSVPAHQRKFGRSDELVGHVRRYERGQLRRLMEVAGLMDIQLANYGYPITELTRVLSNRIVRGDHSYDGMSAVERSIRSAQAKPRRIGRILSMVSGRIVTPFCLFQRGFYRFDLGDGLVATARKPD